MIIYYIILIFLIYIKLNNTYIHDENYIFYKVQNDNSKYKSVKILSFLRNYGINLLKLINKNNKIYIKNKENINDILKKLNYIYINEKNSYDNESSYTVNKREIYLCLKNKKNEFYDLNDIIYVFIHELSHLICQKLVTLQNFMK